MFQSFFPRPKQFFLSAVAWFLVSLAIWHGYAYGLADTLSFMREALPTAEGERPPFFSPEKIWVYQYIVLSSVLFCIPWFFVDRNKWYGWAVCGTALILVVTYFQVQVTVWMNDWYGDFYNMIQLALSEKGVSKVTSEEYFGKIITVLIILVPNITIAVVFSYFTSHYVFRWRTAMNEYYMEHWAKLRTIEGAAQRVQEDTMRFALIMKGLGSIFISSIMTLIAFLPVLWNLSKEVTELPFFGAVDGSFVYIALLSAAFGTVLLAVVGYRLPGLEFNNQKVEAAYRKELVYGEDDDDRADPQTIKELFADVRTNYFKLYFHYLYFNVFRYAYIQGATFIPLIALGPTFIAGAITFGTYQQISNAFSRVENSFQFLANSWTTIIELMSIHKRLMSFESIIHTDTPPPANEAAAI